MPLCNKGLPRSRFLKAPSLGSLSRSSELQDTLAMRRYTRSAGILAKGSTVSRVGLSTEGKLAYKEIAGRYTEVERS